MIIPTSRKRVFICFDLLNDAKLFDFVKTQAKLIDSPFIVIDQSRKWEPPEKAWRDGLKKTISYAELVFIMVGKKTFKAPNVLEEVEIAYNLGKPMMQFCHPGAKFSECKAIPRAGKLYQWEWENLKTAMQNFKYVSHV